MMVNEVNKTYQPKKLVLFSTEVLKRIGVPEKQSEIIAQSLVHANLRGTDSHGMLRLPVYVERISKGLVEENTTIQVERETPTTLLLDGQNGMGQVIGKEAIDMAVEKAKQYQMASVAIKNSNHFGTAAQYAIMAAQQGMIGIVISNTSPLMPPIGGAEPKLGNNPISIAVPSPMEYPVVLDMALSQAAYGKIQLAHHYSQSIPSSWGVDAKGRPTTDPSEVIKSRMLSPMGGPKGYGLAFFADILCGILANTVYGTGVNSLFNFDKPNQCSHFFLVINIEAFIQKETFLEKLKEMIEDIKSTRLAEGSSEIFIPGEIEYRISIDREKNGIPLDEETLAVMAQLSEKYGIPFHK